MKQLTRHSIGGASSAPGPVLATEGGAPPCAALQCSEIREDLQSRGASGGRAHRIAAAGLSGPAQSMPHQEPIQASFGRHDVSQVQAHLGGAAQQATESLGARAYANGERVAFSQAPSLHTAAHEAAHVVQQRAGVSLADGVGTPGDRYEQQADRVADAVERGESSEHLLEGGSSASGNAIQFEAMPDEDVRGMLGALPDSAYKLGLDLPDFSEEMQDAVLGAMSDEGSDSKASFVMGCRDHEWYDESLIAFFESAFEVKDATVMNAVLHNLIWEPHRFYLDTELRDLIAEAFMAGCCLGWLGGVFAWYANLGFSQLSVTELALIDHDVSISHEDNVWKILYDVFGSDLKDLKSNIRGTVEGLKGQRDLAVGLEEKDWFPDYEGTSPVELLIGLIDASLLTADELLQVWSPTLAGLGKIKPVLTKGDIALREIYLKVNTGIQDILDQARADIAEIRAIGEFLVIGSDLLFIVAEVLCVLATGRGAVCGGAKDSLMELCKQAGTAMAGGEVDLWKVPFAALRGYAIEGALGKMGLKGGHTRNMVKTFLEKNADIIAVGIANGDSAATIAQAIGDRAWDNLFAAVGKGLGEAIGGTRGDIPEKVLGYIFEQMA